MAEGTWARQVPHLTAVSPPLDGRLAGPRPSPPDRVNNPDQSLAPMTVKTVERQTGTMFCDSSMPLHNIKCSRVWAESTRTSYLVSTSTSSKSLHTTSNGVLVHQNGSDQRVVLPTPRSSTTTLNYRTDSFDKWLQNTCSCERSLILQVL